MVVIAIPKEEYRAGLEDCKSYLHSRILLAKGVPPQRVFDLQAKLAKLWHPLGRWHMIPIGKGYFNSSFSLVQDLRKVLVVGIWNLNPSTLRLFN